MNNTNDYYNKNAEDFSSESLKIDMSGLYRRFIPHLPTSGSILDAGCGSGRDSKYFKSIGYTVTAFDASSELCSIASTLIGQKVQNLSFNQIEFKSQFDGVWACASLLHLKRAELPKIFIKLSDALRPGGVMYCSFKLGTYEGDRGGRYFTDLNEELLLDVLQSSGLKVFETWITSDLRPSREDEKWINAIIKSA